MPTSKNHPVNIPKGYRVESLEQGLMIIISPRASENLVGEIFIFFWSAFFIIIGLAQDIVVLLLPFWGIGLYFGLVKLLNVMEVVVTLQTLSIRSRPIPAFGNKKIDSTQIESLAITDHSTENAITYQVNTNLKDGRTIKFISGLPDRRHAEFLKKQIEYELKIREQAMEKTQQSIDRTYRTTISWVVESKENSIENPDETDITRIIHDVYAGKADYGILIIDEAENLFMQIAGGGGSLEYCIGLDGPIYGANELEEETAIKCFLSYNAGDEFWKTVLPWKIHFKSIKDSKGK